MIDLRQMLRFGVLGVGLLAMPAFVPAADEPAKEPAKEAPKPETPPEPRPGGGGQRGQRDPAAAIERYKAALADVKLTDEQKPKVEECFAKATKKLDALKANPPAGEGRERFQPYMEVNTELREGIMAVLTDEQKTQFREKLGPAGGGRGGPGGGGGLGALGERQREQFNKNIETLGLSEDQKKKMDAFQADQEKQRDELAKAIAENADGAREKLLAAREERQKKLAEILTPEQMEKLQKLQEEQRRNRGGPGGGGAGGAGERRDL